MKRGLLWFVAILCCALGLFAAMLVTSAGASEPTRIQDLPGLGYALTMRGERVGSIMCNNYYVLYGNGAPETLIGDMEHLYCTTPAVMQARIDALLAAYPPQRSTTTAPTTVAPPTVTVSSTATVTTTVAVTTPAPAPVTVTTPAVAVVEREPVEVPVTTTVEAAPVTVTVTLPARTVRVYVKPKPQRKRPRRHALITDASSSQQASSPSRKP